MHQRIVGIRLVTGLILAGGLLAGSFTPALAGPGQGAADSMTAAARFVPCTDGSNPQKCKPINPEEPSKRGGQPKREPRGGNINPPPPSQPPTFEPPRGGRIQEPDRPDDDDSGPRVSVRTGDSEPFVAQHQPIPDMSDGVFLTPPQPVVHAPKPVAPAPKQITYAPQPVTYAPQPQPQPAPLPVVVAPPDTGVGPEVVAGAGTAGALAVLAALFGAGALFTWRRPVGAFGRD